MSSFNFQASERMESSDRVGKDIESSSTNHPPNPQKIEKVWPWIRGPLQLRMQLWHVTGFIIGISLLRNTKKKV